MECPMCLKSEYVIKNGKKFQKTITGTVKRQRYLCKKCKKTFYDIDDYEELIGHKDIRNKLLGIILKHSFFEFQALSEFFRYKEISTVISNWEKDILKEEVIDVRPLYMKNNTNYLELKNTGTREDILSKIKKRDVKKGIFITLDEECCILDINIFDESANPELTCTTPKQTNSSQKE